MLKTSFIIYDAAACGSYKWISLTYYNL